MVKELTKPLTNKILILIIVIFAALFYWFEIRPSMTRSDCYEQALGFMEGSFSRNSDNSTMTMEEKIQAQYSAYNEAYKRCLHKNGLGN